MSNLPPQTYIQDTLTSIFDDDNESIFSGSNIAPPNLDQTIGQTVSIFENKTLLDFRSPNSGNPVSGNTNFDSPLAGSPLFGDENSSTPITETSMLGTPTQGSPIPEASMLGTPTQESPIPEISENRLVAGSSTQPLLNFDNTLAASSSTQPLLNFDNTLNMTTVLNNSDKSFITPAEGYHATDLIPIEPFTRRIMRPESELKELRKLALTEAGLVPGIIATKPPPITDRNRGGNIVYDQQGQLFKSWMEVNGNNNLIKPIIDTYNAFIDNIPHILNSQTIFARDERDPLNPNRIYHIKIENVKVYPPARDTRGGNPTYCASYGNKFAAMVVGDIVHYAPYEEVIEGQLLIKYQEAYRSPNESLFDIPLMVGSKLDPTINLTARQLEQYQMSIQSPKGYFIVDGAPRILISQQRARFNQIMVQDHKEDDKLIHDVYLTAMSDSGSEQISLRYDKDNGIGYRFRYNGTYNQINVWWIIRILAGMSVQTQYFQALAYDISGEVISQLILSFVRPKNRSSVSSILNSNISATFIDQSQDPCFSVLRQCNPKIKDEDLPNARNGLLRDLNNQLFPNLKLENDTYTRRTYTLALMTARLAERISGVRKPHEMDNWGNKRVDSPGQLLEAYIIRLWSEHVIRANNSYNTTSQMWGGKTQTIIAALKLKQFSDPIWNSLKQQKWLLNQKSKNHENVVQLPKFPNLLTFARKVTSVNISVNRDNPNQEVRFARPSSTGFFDLNDVPDGKSCGLMLRLTVLCKISIRRPEAPIRDIIDNRIILDRQYIVYNRLEDQYKPCFLNGKFMGWGPVEELRNEIRYFKMRNKYYHDIEVVYLAQDDILIVSTFATRPMRPVLVTVKENDEFKLIIDILSIKHNINLWTATYVATDSFTGPIDDFLISNGAIEYISPLEQTNSVIAQTSNSLIQRHSEYLLAQEQVYYLEYELARIRQLERDQPELFESRLKIFPAYGEYQESIFELVALNTKILKNEISYNDALIIWNSHPNLIEEILYYGVDINNLTDISRWIDHIQKITCEYVKESPSKDIFMALDTAREILHRTDRERYCDYCEIDPMGTSSIVVAHISFTHMSEGYRQSYAASQSTQALGHVPLGEIRVEAEPRLLYPQPRSGSNPVQDISGMNQFPTGQRVIVAVMQLGHNQEDATMTYSGAVERGLFMYELNHKYNDIAGQHDEFVKPTNMKVNMHKFDFYKNLGDDGFPIVGSQIQSGECIIGKVRKDANNIYRDASTYMKNGLYGIVRRVIVQGNQVRVDISSVRYPQSGDKFAYDAQKSVMAKVINTEDMPWIADPEIPGQKINMNGVRPTMVINPISFPSRMSNNYLVDVLMGVVSSITGIKYNNSSYRDLDMNTVKRILSDNGYRSDGLHVMYDPISGNRMVSEILIGPSHYDSLSHLAEKKYQSLGVGTLSRSTMQPIEQKGNSGLRLGEMEMNAIISHGAADMLTQKFGSTHNTSGGDCIDVLVCTQCGLPTSDTRKFREPSCEFCSHHKKGVTPVFAVIAVPYIMNNVRLILQGLGNGMRFLVSPDRSKISDSRMLSYLEEIRTNPDINKKKVQYLSDNLTPKTSFELIQGEDVKIDENLLEVSDKLTDIPITTKGITLQGNVGQSSGKSYTERHLEVEIGSHQIPNQSEDNGHTSIDTKVDESSIAASSYSSSASPTEYKQQLNSLLDYYGE